MKRKLFVVDDDSGILEVVTIILSDRGYEVEAISNEKKLFQALKKQIPDLLLLDLRIAGADGAKIVSELKHDAKTQGIPVILMSALQEAKQIAREAGADDFMEKPFEIETLIKKIETNLH